MRKKNTGKAKALSGLAGISALHLFRKKRGDWLFRAAHHLVGFSRLRRELPTDDSTEKQWNINSLEKAGKMQGFSRNLAGI